MVRTYFIFTGRGRARPAGDHEGLEGAGGEELGDALGARTGDVEARTARFHGRRPDDAAVHERGAALLDDPADLARRVRRDGVAVDIGAGKTLRGHLRREVDRRVRWADREDHLAGADYPRHRARVLESGVAGALASPRSAPRLPTNPGSPARTAAPTMGHLT